METTSKTEPSPNKTPKKIPKSPTNAKYDQTTPPCPITFIQTDPNSFKKVVQRLTGSSQPSDQNRGNNNNIPLVKTEHMKQSTSKLYERRNRNNSDFKIKTCYGFSTKTSREALSPSTLDFPSLSLSLSPVTPLTREAHCSPPSSSEREDREITEKGFCFYPSPRDGQRGGGERGAEPQLLQLFPVTSPGRVL